MLEIDNLSIVFRGHGGQTVTAVDQVSFGIERGEIFGLVGESGSGKTSIGRAIVRINPVASGQIRYKGRAISGHLTRKEDRQLTRSIQMIFQDPMASLNERAKIGYIVAEGLYQTGLCKTEAERRERVATMLAEVGLLPEYADRFPHEFSGGQRQRIGLARALIMEPEFVVADEPISALDVSVRAQILNLMTKLKRERSLTYLFIAHDLSVVRFITDRTAVIHRGKLVELAPTEKLFSQPVHPYTQALLASIPQPNPLTERKKMEQEAPAPPPAMNYASAQWRPISKDHFALLPSA